jgi:hypothetical protein
MTTDLDAALSGLDDAEALRLLVLAWRRDAVPLLAQVIHERSRRTGGALAWDLDRFDVCTLPKVLAWCLDSGPTSGQLDVVIDRLLPFLPDPRAQATLDALAAKPGALAERVRALAEMNRLPASPRATAEVLASVRALREGSSGRAEQLHALVVEPTPERRAVLADALADQGEPLGEFVGLQLGRGPSTPPSERELALWEQHGVEWIERYLGSWAAQLDGGNGSGVRNRVRFEGGVPTAVETGLIGPPGPGWRHVRSYSWRPWPVQDESETVEARDRRLAVALAALVPGLTALTAPAAAVALVGERGPWPALQTLMLHGAGGLSWRRLVDTIHAFPSVTVVSIERGVEGRGLATALGSLKDRPLDVTLNLSEGWEAVTTLRLRLPDGRAGLSGRAVPVKKSNRGAWKKLLAEVVKATGQRVAVASGVDVDPALRELCVMPDA